MGLIAFKTYSNCPSGLTPLNIPLNWPWVEQVCSEEESEGLRAKGYTILTEEAYEEYKAARVTEFQNWATTAQQLIAVNTIKNSILTPAKLFGLQVIDQFASENILLGITQAGMTNSVRRSTSQVIAALSTGSLYDGIAEAKAIPAEAKDPIFITDSRLLSFVNKIEEYLGIPLSTSISP